jgi:hypothetical protein
MQYHMNTVGKNCVSNEEGCTNNDDDNMVGKNCVSNEESCTSNDDEDNIYRMNWGDFCYMYAFCK